MTPRPVRSYRQLRQAAVRIYALLEPGALADNVALIVSPAEMALMFDWGGRRSDVLPTVIVRFYGLRVVIA